MDIKQPGIANVLAFLVLILAAVACFFGQAVGITGVFILVGVLALAVVLK